MSPIRQAGLLATFAVLALSGASPPSVPSLTDFHRLKLKTLTIPSTGPIGLIAMARVNGGPPLRLLLDSGARYVVLNKKTAARSGCQGGSTLDLIGAGVTLPGIATALTADTVEVGEILLHGVDVVVVERRLLDGIDGVIPLALFAGFMIQLDMRNRNLDLTPFPDEQAPVPASASRAVLHNGLLFLKGTLNNSYNGYFLLDTGAAYNAISTNLARKMNSSASLNESVSLQGGTANLAAHFVSEILRFRIGSSDLRADPVVTLDLSLTSRYHKIEVSGLLGYPALRDCLVTVNYRDALVQIDRK